MTRYCCVETCSERYVRGGLNVSLHRIPNDLVMRQLWVRNIGIPNFIPTESTRICSKHFEFKCFEPRKGRLCLKTDAVPTLFNIKQNDSDLSFFKQFINIDSDDSLDEQSSSVEDSCLFADNQSNVALSSILADDFVDVDQSNVALASILADGFVDSPEIDVQDLSTRIAESPSDVIDDFPASDTPNSDPLAKRARETRPRQKNISRKKPLKITLQQQNTLTKRIIKTCDVGNNSETSCSQILDTVSAFNRARHHILQQRRTIKLLLKKTKKLQKRVNALSILKGDWSSSEEELEDASKSAEIPLEQDFMNAIPPKNPSVLHIPMNSPPKYLNLDSLPNTITEDSGFSLRLSLEEIRRIQSKFAKDRDWEQYHQPRNLLLAMVAEMGELTEIFQWRGEVPVGLPGWSEEDKEHLGQELSDVLLYLIRLSEKCNIDLPAAVLKKISLNGQKYPASKVWGSSKKYTEYISSSSLT